MAIITISRQVAALGDEVASAIAKKIGYRFITKKELENRIVELGFPVDKLKKYDEKKPGFFASLAKGRDEYLHYLQTAVLESAQEGNCILIGRGAFAILESLPNLISLRFVAKESIRMQRLMNEFNWNEKQALQRINESDVNRIGFHKSFFNVDLNDANHFLMVLNTGIISEELAATAIESLLKHFINDEMEKQGEKRLFELVKCQHLVNKLVFEHKLNVEFLRAKIEGSNIVLQGVADSTAVVERAIKLAAVEVPEYSITSAISVVQDFRTHL